MKNVRPIRGQSSTIVTDVIITNNNNNNVNDGDNCSSNPSDFGTSNNVVSVTTPSFVSSNFELSIPPRYYSPTIPFGETSDSPPHSPLSDDDAAEMYRNLIGGTQTVVKQADK
jgi:hypothetical protein